jgi:hypothetical protein
MKAFYDQQKLKEFITTNQNCQRYLKKSYTNKRKINTTMKICKRIDFVG